MGSLEEQISKCVRVRALVAYNPRPKFYTINTTRDSRNRKKLLTKTQSKRILSAGLVALKNPPRYYKDQFLHLKDALLSEWRNVFVSCKDSSPLLPYGLPVAVHLMLSQ